MKKLLRSRKGVSITEVVIAMAAVLIITGAAITLVASSVKSDMTYNNKSLSLSACENAAECVRFAKDVNTLSQALRKVDFVPDSETSPTHFTFTRDPYVVQVRVINPNEYAVFFNGEQIYALTKT